MCEIWYEWDGKKNFWMPCKHTHTCSRKLLNDSVCKCSGLDSCILLLSEKYEQLGFTFSTQAPLKEDEDTIWSVEVARYKDSQKELYVYTCLLT